METKRINPEKSPKVVGPYSQCVVRGGLLFSSGQIGINPETGKLAEGFSEQARQVLKNVMAILESAGAAPKDVLKATVYLVNLADYKELNSIYSEFFGTDFPARSAVQVSALPAGALVEIDIVVAVPGKEQ
jgi:2-iminobutanoate/2-iminopropanoate deaminase